MFMKNKKEFLYYLVPVLVLAVFITYLQYYLIFDVFYPTLTFHSNETEEFREMNVPSNILNKVFEFSEEHQLDSLECLTTIMIQNEFDISLLKDKNINITDYNNQYNFLQSNYKEEFDTLLTSYETIWMDLYCFPIPENSKNQDVTTFFENSWRAERKYENKKSRHEGTDIMTNNNQRGYFPVVSMTDGIVEQVGWLEKGGYRIGIRSPHGGYFYYAHLYNYASDFQPGDIIIAGQLLGFMGDSGYSKVEGTVGNFDVHLHLGIYIETDNYNEISINPYWILKYLDNKRLSFIY